MTLEEEAEALAVHRLANFRENSSTKYKNADKHRTQFLGFIGEVGVGRCFGLHREHLWNIGSDGGSDYCFIIDGIRYTLDVKTAGSEYGLMVEPVRRQPADIYLLTQYIDSKFRFVGWEAGPDVINAPMRDLGHGASHHIPSNQLRSVESLCNIMARRDR